MFVLMSMKTLFFFFFGCLDSVFLKPVLWDLLTQDSKVAPLNEFKVTVKQFLPSTAVLNSVV